MNKTHNLKTWTEHFRDVKSEDKTVEMRIDDRNYEVGDILNLWDFDPETNKYTGDMVVRMVTHTLRVQPFVPKGYVALSIKPLIMPIKAKLMNTTDPQFLPSRKYPKDAGADLRARIDRPIRVYPHVMHKIPVGCAVEIPDGYVGLIQPRSGASSEGKLAITGVIDSTYRGEMCVNVFYLLDEGYVMIQPFERIAQLVVVPVYLAEFVLVNELSETDRGERGFGSSGKY